MPRNNATTKSKMRINILATIVCLSVTTPVFSQQLYKGQPLLKATSDRADIAVGSTWTSGRWRISPEIAHDTFPVMLYGKSEKFGFRTDKDSILFTIKKGETRSFYIQLPAGAPAHTVVVAKIFPWQKALYETTPASNAIHIFYDAGTTGYSDSLRKAYPLTNIIANDRTDQQKVMSILNWTHHQWKHNGGVSPVGNTGMAILNEAAAGGQFPCFAYAIVLRDQLAAHGFAARVLYLKTKDAETRKGSPGHVVTEVYLADQRKWVFVDGQFNIMPMLNGRPLNAVEFQQALSTQYDKVVMASKDKVDKRGYTDFVYDYLYYFDTKLDNRSLPANDKFSIDGKTSLMLVPAGAPELTKISFWNSDVNYCVYTRSVNDFYARPAKAF